MFVEAWIYSEEAFGRGVLWCGSAGVKRKSAVKLIDRGTMQKKPVLAKYLEQEIRILKQLDHPNIVRFQFNFETAEFAGIGMEYCEEGNLLSMQSRLRERVFELKTATRIIVDVLMGLECLHKQSIIHRDIKSQNVLLVRKNNELSCKLADFGFARSIASSSANTNCGTLKYMAPQILAKEEYSISVDIWSLGVLFYFMLFGEFPFRGHHMQTEHTRKCLPFFNLNAVISDPKKFKPYAKELPHLEDFFRKIFTISAENRLTFSKIVRHPIFAAFSEQFQTSSKFYGQFEKKEQKIRDDVVEEEQVWGEVEDKSRVWLQQCNRKGVPKGMQRELQQIRFQVDRVQYLRECASEIYDKYKFCLTQGELMAARYQLLKAYLFYTSPLLQAFLAGQLPPSLVPVITPARWQECIRTSWFQATVNNLKEQHLKAQMNFEEAWDMASHAVPPINIRYFEEGLKATVEEKNFQEMKKSYRSTIMRIFIRVRESKMDSHTINKIKVRLFCCHMVNQMFDRQRVRHHFPNFFQWVKSRGINFQHEFDFLFFKDWIHKETEENLAASILNLTSIFFSNN